MPTERALVTGGAGFIGSHLVERLLERGYRVRVLDNLSTGSLENLSRVRDDLDGFSSGDIRSDEACFDMVRGCDWVFHLAALGSVPRSIAEPVTTHRVNVDGTLNLLRAAAGHGVERFVFASSSSVYGGYCGIAGKAIGETSLSSPKSPYAASKLAGEAYCHAFRSSFGLPTVSLRFFNVFGLRQTPFGAYAAVVPRFLEARRLGLPAVIYGDGHQSRDFTYVDNVVDAILASATHPSEEGPFNVGAGRATTIRELAKLIGVEACHEDPRPGDVRHSCADIRLAQMRLEYTPRISVEEGIKIMIGGSRCS